MEYYAEPGDVHIQLEMKKQKGNESMVQQMTKTLTLTTVLVALFACTVPNQAFASEPFQITLVGEDGVAFCDYIDVTEGGNMLWGTHNQSACNAPNANVIGQIIQVGDKILVNPPFTAASPGANISSWVLSPTALTYLFDNATQTWANYKWDGATFTLINTGTYTVALGATPIKRTGPPSYIKAQ